MKNKFITTDLNSLVQSWYAGRNSDGTVKAEDIARYELRYTLTKRVYAVWDKVKPFIPKEYHNIVIAFTSSEEPDYKTYVGGYAIDGTIVIGMEYLNRFSSEESIACMLFHELGHHILGHFNLDDMDPVGEQDCDHLMIFFSQMCGYDPLTVLAEEEKYELFRQGLLSDQHIEEHGTGDERIERLLSHLEYLDEMNS